MIHWFTAFLWGKGVRRLQASILSQIPGSRLLGGWGRRRGGGGGHPWQIGVSVKVVGAVDDGEVWKTRERSLFVNARICPYLLVSRLRIVHGT